MLASVVDQFPQINPEDRSLALGLIGSGIGQSLTPALHRAEAKAQGILLDYQLIDVDQFPPNGVSLAELLQIAQNKGYRGLNITHPFKIQVLDELDELSGGAGKVGSVNTILFNEGRRIGHNTDLWGFCESFRRNLPGARMGRVLLMGAGGAGMAVAHGLLELGAANLSICDTDIERAEMIAEKVQSTSSTAEIRAISHEDLAASQFDGLVNATPVGMAKMPGSAVSQDLLSAEQWVADLVYFPLETQLLREAKARGCRVLPGSGMAVFQAVRAFELFTDLKADASRMLQFFEAFSPNSPRQRAEG